MRNRKTNRRETERQTGEKQKDKQVRNGKTNSQTDSQTDRHAEPDLEPQQATETDKDRVQVKEREIRDQKWERQPHLNDVMNPSFFFCLPVSVTKQ